MSNHPSLPTTKKKQCLGFTKEHRRCRLERVDGKKTCHIHRNYYNQWIQKELPMLKYMHWSTTSSRIKKEIEFQLKFCHVPITKEFIVNEFWNITSTEGYELLILFHSIDPLWCPRVFDYLLDKYIYQFLYSQHNSMTIFPTDVKKYHALLESIDSLQTLQYIFSYTHFRCIWYLNQKDFPTESPIDSIYDTLMILWNVTLSSRAWKPLFFMTFDIEEYLNQIRTFLILKYSLYNEVMDSHDFNQSIQEYLVFIRLFFNQRFNMEKSVHSQKPRFYDELAYTVVQKNWRSISTV